ncbi:MULTISPECIES: restriction endonuclease NlaIII [Dokdonia]|uniref:Restriction endonuclease NlaIII n=2 Tax=Dokdonia TaxID=326319 RepID=A0A0A2GWA3_9FLAO|nr:restriction endonuclease NlaIII [Dokdonia donghaensis]ANH60214.1 ICEA Protein [Dokdonia donghaensis DSW-1]KGO07502.1 restriction endonuclease NlaIII [Dokdonia donghaensis DSW-1]
MTKTELFLELAQPNEKGVSRWVYTSEFKNTYAALKLGNGGSWCRKSSKLAKNYLIEFNKNLSPGNSIDAIRTTGINNTISFNQNIRQDIKTHYKDKKCVMLGISGNSENTIIEIDHKDGRKNDARVSNLQTQKIEDFQPLTKAANDAKRQICKKCAETNLRWSAKNIKGNPYDFYEGTKKYTEELGCKGCYQFDPVKYRLKSIELISKEAAEYVSKKLMNN